MDKILWQTPESIDFIYSSYVWIQTVLSCGKHCQTMQTGTVSRLRLCRRSWGFKIYIRWNIVRIRKPYVCSNKLDVQETRFSFAQFKQNQKAFPWMQDWGWTENPRLIYGIWSSQLFTEKRIRVITNGETRTNFQRERNFIERLMIQIMLILFPQTCIIFVRKLCCIFLKTTKQWSRWS